MLHLTRKRTLKVPAETAWKAVADFRNIHLFNPMVQSSPLLSEETCGIGAVRRCEFKNNTSVVETITEWREGESFTVALTEMSMPLEKAWATMTVSPASEESCTVSLSMAFIPKWGVMGSIMGALMMKPMMGRMFNQVLIGLEQFLQNKNQELGVEEKQPSCSCTKPVIETI